MAAPDRRPAAGQADRGIADRAERQRGVLEGGVGRKDQHGDGQQRPLPHDRFARSDRDGPPCPRQQRQAGQNQRIAQHDGCLQPRRRQPHIAPALPRPVGDFQMAEHLGNRRFERQVFVPAQAEGLARRRSDDLRPVQQAHLGSVDGVADEQQREQCDARVDEGAPVRDQQVEEEDRRKHLDQCGRRDRGRHHPHLVTHERVQGDRHEAHLPGLHALDGENRVERREIQPQDSQPRDHERRVPGAHERPQRGAGDDEPEGDADDLDGIEPVGKRAQASRADEQGMKDEEENGTVLHDVVEMHRFAGLQVDTQRRQLLVEFRQVLLPDRKHDARLHEVRRRIAQRDDRHRPDHSPPTAAVAHPDLPDPPLCKDTGAS